MADSRLILKFRDLALNCQQIGQDVERGQANTPLADHCAQILRELQYQPYAITLVSLAPDARTEALLWLLGEEHHGVSMQISRLGGLAEIHLAQHSYAFLESDGRKLEFESLPGFIAALEQELPKWSAALDAGSAIKLALAAPAGAQGLTILLPESLAATGSVAGLAGELISRSQRLLVASTQDQAPPEGDDLAFLRHLASGIGCVLPLVTNPQPENATPQRWWSNLSLNGARILAPVVPGKPHSPCLLTSPVQELLPLLAMTGAVQRLQLASEALRERLEQDIRQLQSRRSREEDAARPETTVDVSARRPFDLARAQALDELAALAKASVESSRRSLLPEGPLTLALGEELRGLQHADLEREQASKTFKLSLSSSYQGHLAKTLRSTLKEELSRDLVTIRDGLDVIRTRLEATLEETCGMPVSFTLTPPSKSELWARIGELVAIEIRYRGEMPRRGFMQRLGEGRRAVFAGMMVLSLVGSFVGFSWRGIGIMGALFLLVFIGVVFFTYKSWQREDEEKLDNELVRIREQLQSECRRVASDVQREKQTRLAEFLDQIKRLVQQRIDDLSRERQQRDQASQNEQRERSRIRLKKLDQQLRELQAITPRATKLRQDLASLNHEAELAVRDFIQQRKLGT